MRADDRDLLLGRGVEWKDAVVLEENNRLLRRLQRKALVRGLVDVVDPEVEVWLRRLVAVEEPELHLDRRQPRKALVHLGLGEEPRIDRVHDLLRVNAYRPRTLGRAQRRASASEGSRCEFQVLWLLDYSAISRFTQYLPPQSTSVPALMEAAAASVQLL